MTKQEALEKTEELKKFIENEDKKLNLISLLGNDSEPEKKWTRNGTSVDWPYYHIDEFTGDVLVIYKETGVLIYRR